MSQAMIEIAERTNALYDAQTGHIEFRRMNAQGDWILGTSSWNALTGMTDEQVKAYFDRHKESIEVDFSEALRMR